MQARKTQSNGGSGGSGGGGGFSVDNLLRPLPVSSLHLEYNDADLRHYRYVAPSFAIGNSDATPKRPRPVAGRDGSASSRTTPGGQHHLSSSPLKGGGDSTPYLGRTNGPGPSRLGGSGGESSPVGMACVSRRVPSFSRRG